jgi:hypothetical protein
MMSRACQHHTDYMQAYQKQGEIGKHLRHAFICLPAFLRAERVSPIRRHELPTAGREILRQLMARCSAS